MRKLIRALKSRSLFLENVEWKKIFHVVTVGNVWEDMISLRLFDIFHHYPRNERLWFILSLKQSFRNKTDDSCVPQRNISRQLIASTNTLRV